MANFLEFRLDGGMEVIPNILAVLSELLEGGAGRTVIRLGAAIIIAANGVINVFQFPNVSLIIVLKRVDFAVQGVDVALLSGSVGSPRIKPVD